jgi:hypothetical protein
MANSPSITALSALSSRDAQTVRRRPRPRGTGSARRAWSERQLDAYLMARDTLRRLRAMASPAPDASRCSSPPASQGGSSPSH